MSKKADWLAADETKGQKQPHLISGKALQTECQLAIHRLILKLTYQSYNILDKTDLANLSGLLRSTRMPKDAKMVFDLIENNNLDCRDVRRLIADEYGITLED